MRKVSLIGVLLLVVSIPTFAGGLLTNTNQHVLFLRSLARDASTQIDAVYSNPAGTAYMTPGLHLSLNVQSAYQTRTINSTFDPFVGFGGNATKQYKGEASAPVIPSMFAVYVKDKWAFSASFAVTGGGGKATFNNGLGSFESQVAMIPENLKEAGIPTSQYSVDSYMQGKQMIFGLQVGAAYKINDYLSAFGGLRMNYVSNGYVGHIKDIMINPTYPAVGLNGSMVSAETVFKTLAAAYTAMGNSKGAEDMQKNADAVKDKYLDCDQTGWGVTPIIGLDFKMNKWNVGVKYEFNTRLNVENNTKIDNTGMFKDGVNTPHDIPSLLTVGVSYEILPVLRASVGYHHFFDSNAKMANGKEKYAGSTNEYLGGLEWDITKAVQVSAGLQRTKYGVQDNYQSDMSFSVSSFSYGFGAGFNLSSKLKLNVAYFWTEYEDYTKEVANFATTTNKTKSFNYKDVFTRTNKVFGIGVDYKF